MAGKRLVLGLLGLFALMSAGCCHWCDRWCGNRAPAYAPPAYAPACVPCTPTPACCPTSVGSAPPAAGWARTPGCP